MRYDDTINAESTIKLLEQIADAYPDVTKITVICDNARYNRSKLIKAHLASAIVCQVQHSNITLLAAEYLILDLSFNSEIVK